MGAYKRDVVVVIKMSAYIYGVLILCGCLLSRFYGTYTSSKIIQLLGYEILYTDIYSAQFENG